MIPGILYIISAPSGAGKSSLIKALLSKKQLSRLYNKTKISISHTTRPMRPGEVNGEHYYFVSVQEFKKMIAKSAFLEYAKIFNHYYGTSRKAVEFLLKNGCDVFLNIDWQGAQQIRNLIPDARSIFIMPPSKDELYKRLCSRGQDSEHIITQRIEQSVAEMIHYNEYNYLIINDDFNDALYDLTTIIRAESLLLKPQQLRNAALISKLLFN
ncbi:guanylate kinase [Candidatus Palibaumannia cicadellinicola]|uniref:Guanylate kinase n=1 Tax=Candidatus Palibaumannia cicadellinicola TaxID=186490 RepID=A0A0K2BK47_9GAMM|nr:guanylate kinase [Candidatus Baumannia cicadellinicola]AKZ65710.1 Guanylate kinase [Candidatus Baumannia cicadellinicola]